MKIYDFSEIHNLHVVGDIHGDFNGFFNKIKRNLNYKKEDFIEDVHPLVKEENENGDATILQQIMPRLTPFYKTKTEFGGFNNSLIIVCGDCGFGFNKPGYYFEILEKANKLFSTTNTHIIFVRGNHDDPSYFTDEKINYSNIICVPDYSVVKTFDHNILCVGGAISVDRIWRKQQEIRLNKYKQSNPKKLFWENEAPILNENILNELKENDIKLDMVVTHTSPSFSQPHFKDTAIGWFKTDPKLKEDLKKERNIMDSLYKLLRNEHDIKVWSYGHFHIYFEDLIDEKTLFLANGDDLSISNPFLVYEKIVVREKAKKEKRKRKKKSEPSIDDLIAADIDSVVPIEPRLGAIREVEFNPEVLERVHAEIDRIDRMVYNHGYDIRNEHNEGAEEIIFDEIIDEAPF